MERLEGTRIDHFRIIERLGAGGMGVVYRARDEELQRTVALKLLRGGGLESREARARLLREARAAAALTHPNVVTVHEVGEDAKGVFIVSELVDGPTLRARIEEGPIPIDLCLSIARQIASALAAAHERGIVHRDLKPDNVMLSAGTHVKLLDFGLAKFREPPVDEPPVEGESTMSLVTAEGRIMGTPGYMAPEQAMGQPSDERTDVFAFGVVLYELLTGKPPFAGETATERMMAAVTEEAAPPSSVEERVPAWLDGVVARCLAKKPADRYPSAIAIVVAMKEGEARPTKKTGGSTLMYLVWAGCVSAALVLYFVVTRERSKGDPTSRASASAAPSASALSSATGPPGWPIPTLCKDDATKEVKLGIDELRGGAWPRAHEHFERAVSLDPECASAAARVVITGYYYDTPDEARAAYRAAYHLRNQMSERDRAYFDTYEPLLARSPPDEAEHVRRQREVSDRYPTDPEIAVSAAFAVSRRSRDWDETKRLAERALGVDPSYADAWQALGRAEYWREGADPAAASRAFDRCMEVAPMGTDCVEESIIYQIALGACDKVEDLAKKLATRDPRSEAAYWFVGLALASGDASRASVEEALRQRLARTAEAERKKRELFDGVRVAAAYGDFAEVERALALLREKMAAETDFATHAEYALLAAGYFEEIGRGPDAVAVADGLFAARRAIPGDSYAFRLRYAVYHAEPVMLRVRIREKHVEPAEVEERLAAFTEWVSGVKNHDVRSNWAYTKALFVDSAERARTELTAMPKPLSPMTLNAELNLAVGRTLLLAEAPPADALRYLRPAAGACRALEEPFAWVQARLALGEALEVSGDTGGACRAYAEVVRRWHGAKGSRTAAAAQAKASKLKCVAATR